MKFILKNSVNSDNSGSDKVFNSASFTNMECNSIFVKIFSILIIW